jgi:hypothetical protein
MEIKYALLNPANGEHEFFETELEVKQALASRALSFYVSHSHGIFYNKITIDENGWETWDAQNSVNQLDEAEIESFIASKV